MSGKIDMQLLAKEAAKSAAPLSKIEWILFRHFSCFGTTSEEIWSLASIYFIPISFYFITLSIISAGQIQQAPYSNTSNNWLRRYRAKHALKIIEEALPPQEMTIHDIVNSPIGGKKDKICKIYFLLDRVEDGEHYIGLRYYSSERYRRLSSHPNKERLLQINYSELEALVGKFGLRCLRPSI